MKKENVLKKVLVKSLVGFTAGVTLLMIAYASVYFIAGESVFKNEISQLQNIKTLITQFVVIGIAYYLIFISFRIFSILQNKDLKEMKSKVSKANYEQRQYNNLDFLYANNTDK